MIFADCHYTTCGAELDSHAYMYTCVYNFLFFNTYDAILVCALAIRLGHSSCAVCFAYCGVGNKLSFLKRNSILFPHATFLSVCLRLFFGQTKETTTKQETKTHEHLKKGNACSTYNVLRFHSRVGRAGRPKNSDKRLVRWGRS